MPSFNTHIHTHRHLLMHTHTPEYQQGLFLASPIPPWSWALHIHLACLQPIISSLLLVDFSPWRVQRSSSAEWTVASRQWSSSPGKERKRIHSHWQGQLVSVWLGNRKCFIFSKAGDGYICVGLELWGISLDVGLSQTIYKNFKTISSHK